MTTVPAGPTYDAYAEFYTAPVQATRAVFDDRLKDTLYGKTVLDVGCDEVPQVRL